MPGSRDQSEPHTLRGATDRAALLRIRDIVTAMEPLAAAELDDYLNPSVLKLTLDDGLCAAETGRIDIQWTTHNDYKFHYTDEQDVDFRWGKHPHGEDYIHVPGLEHYHPPPDATSDPDEVEASCITHSPVDLVIRAVLTLWRIAYQTNSYEALNAGQNPP